MIVYDMCTILYKYDLIEVTKDEDDIWSLRSRTHMLIIPVTSGNSSQTDPYVTELFPLIEINYYTHVCL